jgi:hypothetical protein
MKPLLVIALWRTFTTWMPTWYPDGQPETEAERIQRFGVAAQAVGDESTSGRSPLNPIDQAALISTVWKNETALDYAVHVGDIDSPIGHQDHGAARCFGQIHHTPTWITREEWLGLTGTSYEATARCAYWTNDMLRRQARRCLAKDRQWGEPLSEYEAAQVLAGYGTGLSCEVQPRHAKRAADFVRIRARLLRATE